VKLDSVAEYLAAQGLGVIGTSLFMHSMPEKVKQGVLLLSGLGGTKIDPYLPGFYRAKFQVIVRHQDHQQGVALADQVKDALTLRQVQMTGAKFHFIQPIHEPVVFPVSKGDNLEISINFDAAYVATT
jgi:hypothetical protein